MAHEVFISYAREDTAVATAAVECLSKWGVRCWIDRETIAHAHGSEWSREIVAAITQSKAVVLVLSRSANESSFVASEAHVAFDRGIPILPFRIEDVPPGDSLALYLSRVQWLDAFPIFEQHLETLADRTTRLIDKRGAAPGGATRPRVGFWRLISGHATHLLGRGRRWFGDRTAKSSASSATTPSPQDAPEQDDPTMLVRDGRWWRLRTMIDACEREERPLRRLEPWREAVARRMAEFDAAFGELSRRLESTSPSRLGPDLERLRQIVPDHPRLRELQSRFDDRDSELSELRREVSGLRTHDRWLAIENAIRRFLLTHRQQSPSLVEAAEHACASAMPEARRLLLLLWTIVAPIIVITATWMTLSVLGALDGSLTERFTGEGVLRSIGPGMVAALVQLGVAAAVLSLLLTLIRRRSAAGFTGAALVAIGIAVALQAAPLLLQAYPALASEGSWWRALLLGVGPAAAFTLAMTMVAQLATCRATSLAWALPSGSTLLGCLVVAALLASTTTESEALLRPEWLRWLPHAAVFSGLLGASALLAGRLCWWIALAVPTATGAVLGGSWSGEDPLGLQPIAAASVVLFISGCLASPRHSIPGYLAIALLAILASGIGAAWTSVDAGSAADSGVQLAVLAAIWGIACSEVALTHADMLARRVSIRDGLVKLVLLVRSRGTPLAGGWLAETEWCKNARRTRSPISAAKSRINPT